MEGIQFLIFRCNFRYSLQNLLGCLCRSCFSNNISCFAFQLLSKNCFRVYKVLKLVNKGIQYFLILFFRRTYPLHLEIIYRNPVGIGTLTSEAYSQLAIYC